MFIHKSKLEHLLQPYHYISEEWYETELRRILRPSWQPIGTIHDLRKPGDYITFELFGEPVLVRNFGGELVAMQNVCAHRHCRIRSEDRGHSDRLMCQYHGWEFNKEGRTGKIPDAQAFRPWDRENACLKRFRVDAAGEMVFVSLAPEGQTLPEFLGDVYPLWRDGFDGQNFEFVGSWHRDFDANWKIPCENSLESYHIPQVHPKTFVTYPDEPSCEHVLRESYTLFNTPTPDPKVARQQAFLMRRMGMPVTDIYTHLHVHPNLLFASTDANRLAMIVTPLSATRCRYKVYAYSARGTRRNPVAWASKHLVRQIVKYFSKKVYDEDSHIYGECQKGLAASGHRGVIGNREERIYVFQKWVLDQCESHVRRGVPLPTLT